MTIQLYDFYLSGNSHKVRNLLSLLGVEHELIDVDLLAGEQRSQKFLALNPFAQVPVLVDGDVVVRDSSAILVYLGRRFGHGEWLPLDAEGESKVQEWLATASTDVANGPAFARLITVFGANGDLAEAQERAHAVIERFEEHLADRSFLVSDTPTIADIANYSYLALAPDGGVELDAYPNVRAWIERLAKRPGATPIPVKPGKE